MSSVKPVVSYAQYREDLTLAALLHEKEKGFYVDVGANHEEIDSVTKYFYERGWSGINIEPIPKLIKEFQRKRKRDINLNLAIADERSTVKFREYIDHDGLSFVVDNNMTATEKNIPFREYEVPVDTLADIFKQNSVSEIDFLKIDVEGLEEKVLRGNDWSKYRPKVICIEANHRVKDWSKLLTSNGYKLFIFDGLNEYYVVQDYESLTQGFAERAALLSQSSFRPEQFRERSHIINERQKLSELIETQDQEIKRLSEQNRALVKKLENVFSALHYSVSVVVKKLKRKV